MPTKIEYKSKCGNYIRTPEIREKNRIASTGHKNSEEQKQKVAKFMKEWHRNHKHPRLGKKHSIKTKNKMSQNRQGIKNANWKNGVTEFIRGIRRSPQYYQWRKEVLKRDENKCKFCGSGNKINIHHKLTIFDYPEKIFEIDNGIALCEKCHKKIHFRGLNNGKKQD